MPKKKGYYYYYYYCDAYNDTNITALAHSMYASDYYTLMHRAAYWSAKHALYASYQITTLHYTQD